MTIKNWNKEGVMAFYKKKAADILNESGQDIQDDVRKSMKTGAGKLWSSHKGDGSMHMASVKGKAPAPDTNRLHNSVTYKVSDGRGTIPSSPASPSDGVGVPSVGTNEVAVAIGTNVEYALVQEEGYKFSHGGRIAERPYLRPALKKNKKKIMRKFKKQ